MVEELVRRARQRCLVNESLAQLAFAAAVFAAGFVLILIFGTRFLAVWTLALFAAAGLAAGAWRVRRRTPDRYATAILLDASAGLHDALSTALHFSGRSSAEPYAESDFSRSGIRLHALRLRIRLRTGPA